MVWLDCTLELSELYVVCHQFIAVHYRALAHVYDVVSIVPFFFETCHGISISITNGRATRQR